MPEITWEHVRERLNALAIEDGNWAGCPLPLEHIPLVVEPRYPYAKLNGFCLGGRTDDGPADEPDYTVVNSWYSVQRNATVYVIREANGQSTAVVLPEWGGTRLKLWVDTIAASKAWDRAAERRAVETLETHLSVAQADSYALTGTFLETSKRSGVVYLFRKLRPTIAIRATERGSHILAVLCLHPIGHYEGTWGGVMVPSDDVMAHLLLMRADEAYLWRKANLHPSWAASAGI